MLLGVLALAISCTAFSLMPADIPLPAYILPLVAKGVFGVLLVIPVAGLTFRELKAEHFAHGYRNKNLLRQWAGSLAQAVAAIMMQNRQASVYDSYVGQLNPFNERFNATVHALQGALQQGGMAADAASHAALAQVAGMLDRQVLLVACDDLYRTLTVLALCSAVVVALQRRLR